MEEGFNKLFAHTHGTLSGRTRLSIHTYIGMFLKSSHKYVRSLSHVRLHTNDNDRVWFHGTRQYYEDDELHAQDFRKKPSRPGLVTHLSEMRLLWSHILAKYDYETAKRVLNLCCWHSRRWNIQIPHISFGARDCYMVAHFSCPSSSSVWLTARAATQRPPIHQLSVCTLVGVCMNREIYASMIADLRAPPPTIRWLNTRRNWCSRALVGSRFWDSCLLRCGYISQSVPWYQHRMCRVTRRNRMIYAHAVSVNAR